MINIQTTIFTQYQIKFVRNGLLIHQYQHLKMQNLVKRDSIKVDIKKMEIKIIKVETMNHQIIKHFF